MIWKLKTKTLTCDTHHPLIMGILNVTPDSFSDGGTHFSLPKAIDHALRMQDQGADLIDIGGESSRPQATPVSLEEELQRVIPLVQGLRGKIQIPISIDTTKSEVARQALEAGAEIINDISAGSRDPALLSVVKDYQAGYVLMHSQGTPQTMQNKPEYMDVVEDIFLFLKNNLQILLSAGLSPESVVVDIGFGFGKTMEHNVTLLKNLQRFVALDRPVLVGLSRKSFLRNRFGAEAAETSTSLAHFWSALQGASLWRTHDIAQAITTRKILGVVS